ncbi:MAG: response regulator [Alphaproteobacteria bacterium]|nr:response regulator [Alphaproteobacteria bacterium]MDE2012227.1 response regulator [Alphaproteobacteria bacterium]MDE2074822.1 response regulator [Alphaproteobacteria bacterium]MDE2351696.1 response regulator [Alphaproteobacteria bacterium]
MNGGSSTGLQAVTWGRYGIPAGAWRWAALAFVAAAVVSAGLAIGAPDAANWAGVALLAGIGAVASLFLYAIWPREGISAAEARRVAEAAARANVAWAVTGPDGAVLDCNAAYRALSGSRADEAAIPPELALAGESSAAVLYRLARKAGEGKAAEESFRAGPRLEIVAAVRPLPEGQAAWWFTPRLGGDAPAPQAAPASNSAGAPTLYRDAPVGMALCDADGKLIESNRAFDAFFAVAVTAGQKLASLVDADGTLGELIAAALEGKSHAPAEIRPRSDADRIGELFAIATAAKQGEAGRAMLYLIDISAQKALETKFAQAQKMQAVGQLAGGVAHDFNNLLTVIIGNCEFLLMRHPAGDPSFKEINEIQQNALRAANLVRQLLAFSRKQTLQPKVLALRDVLGELAMMLQRLLREGISLKVEPARDLWPVHADEAQITSAIINLVVNARDAMPQGGAVSIHTENETVAAPVPIDTAIMPAGDYVRIDVADTGTGIPKEHLGKIFDPFFTTKPTGQGTGLGLATVYGIVKQTGGFITVESEVGKGTTFRIYLPRFKGEIAATAMPERTAPRDVTGQDTILLVEDEDAVRAFAARALKLRGYNVLEASGGEEALELVKDHGGAIQLLVTDVVMPNMDGPTLVRNVRRLIPEVRVIFMSGYAEDAFRRHDEKAENLHFLPKPFGLKELAAKVKDVLSEAPVK